VKHLAGHDRDNRRKWCDEREEVTTKDMKRGRTEGQKDRRAREQEDKEREKLEG
jgi:hypothetical protein